MSDKARKDTLETVAKDMYFELWALSSFSYQPSYKKTVTDIHISEFKERLHELGVEV